MSSRKVTALGSFIMLAVLASLGCQAHEENSRTTSGASPTQEAANRRVVPLAADAILAENILTVTVERRVECRDAGYSEWKTCEKAPLKGAYVVVESTTVLDGTTDHLGKATIDLSALASGQFEPRQATIHVNFENTPTVHQPLDLSTSPMAAAWKAANTHRPAESDVDKLKKECDSGDGSSCFALGDRLRRRNDAGALAYFQRGCELKHSVSCAAVIAEREPLPTSTASSDPGSADAKSVQNFRGSILGTSDRVVLNFSLAKGENIVRIRASSRVGCTVAVTAGRSREVFARSDGKENRCELSVTAKAPMTVDLELYRVMGSTLTYEGEILRR